MSRIKISMKEVEATMLRLHAHDPTVMTTAVDITVYILDSKGVKDCGHTDRVRLTRLVTDQLKNSKLEGLNRTEEKYSPKHGGTRTRAQYRWGVGNTGINLDSDARASLAMIMRLLNKLRESGDVGWYYCPRDLVRMQLNLPDDTEDYIFKDTEIATAMLLTLTFTEYPERLERSSFRCGKDNRSSQYGYRLPLNQKQK